MICSWVNGFVGMKKLAGLPAHLTSRQCAELKAARNYKSEETSEHGTFMKKHVKRVNVDDGTFI